MNLRFLAALIAVPSLCIGQSTLQDSPPMDPKAILEVLKSIKDSNESGIKTRRLNAYNQVMQAASSGAAAAAFWKQAVAKVQFAGADHSSTKMSDWKDGDGEAFSSKECQNAAMLHLYWLGLSLQHSMGTETKSMLPNIIEFTKKIRAQEETMERLDNAIDRAKERKDREKADDEQTVKRVHDQILRASVGSTPVARWLQLSELLGDTGKKRGPRGEKAADKPDAKPDSEGGWEMTPGNVDGIYGSIILPEFRATKDPRLLEFWDMKIKLETEKASEKKLDVEQRDWLQVRRPGLQWGRTQDMIVLGLKNRAIAEMVSILKANPQHPSVPNWISAIEGALLGNIPAPVAPAATAPAGGVAAPVAVPPATAPSATVDPFRLNPVRPPAQ
jgi:hypothetical protein